MGAPQSFLGRDTMKILDFQKEYQVEFDNPELLKQAFIHSSYANEHQYKNIQDNERLEFLGDAVLEISVSKYIYGKYTSMAEGKMTRLRAALVCEPSLAKIAKEIGFGNYIILGKGEDRSGGRQRISILADVFEAFLGALYIDQGLRAVDNFLMKHMFPRIKNGAYSHTMDYKSKLQEILQQHIRTTATYQDISKSGPAHNRTFTVGVYIKNELLATGRGKSKKIAEQNAAEQALDRIVVKNGNMSFNRLNS